MAELTPTKTVSRSFVSPNSKTSICVVCFEKVEISDYRRRLFVGLEKTQACINLEIIVGAQIGKEAGSSTDIVCRNCDRRNSNVVKKILELRDLFYSTQSKLVSRSACVTSIKRQNKENVTAESQRKYGTKRLARDLFSEQVIPSTLSCTERSTQTFSWPDQRNISAVHVVIQYPNSPNRIVQLKEERQRIGRQLALGDNRAIANAVLAVPDINENICELIGNNIKSEISSLCSKTNPSVLRKSSPEELADFSWEKVNQELLSRTPRLMQFLQAAIANPSQSRNVLKTKSALNGPMLDAGCQLIAIFNEDMNVTRKLKSVILKKGGLKKIAFKRLSSLYVCMSYASTNKLFESAGKGFDRKLKDWKEEIERGVEEEKCILRSLENASESEVDKLSQQLVDHRKKMHPGYSFTGDNVDMRILPRQMTLNNKNKDHHMYQIVAFKNRVPSNDFSNNQASNDVKSLPLSVFLPSAEEQSTLVDELVILIGHIWGKYIPSLEWFSENLPSVIAHEQMENTRKKTEKVHLGVLRKNEQYEDDMLDILEWIHPYVPGHNEESYTKPVKVLSGGDYLTFERHKEAQSSMQDARTPSARLEGLVPKMEDFHTQAEWLKVIWHHLYDTSSCRDKGTLYAIRNLLDARNVTADPHNNFYGCSEFLDKVLNAYLICGALQTFGMKHIDDQPTQNTYSGQQIDTDAKKRYINQVIKRFVQEHVVNNIPQVQPESKKVASLSCQICDKKYVRPHALRKHQEKIHNLQPVDITAKPSNTVSEQDKNQDMVYNYTHQLLVLLLLRLNHNDAIKLGDGVRVLRLYKFFCLYFKVSNCPKYAMASLHLQAQVNCLLSPRLAHSLIWNRFVNHQGKLDTNFPMDLDVEHDNRAFKGDIHSFKGEITDKSIARVSQATEPTDAILHAFDKSTHVKKPSGKHTSTSTKDDIMLLVKHLQEEDLYKTIPGRKHIAFSNMTHNVLADIDADALRSWITKSLNKFSKKHFYKL